MANYDHLQVNMQLATESLSVQVISETDRENLSKYFADRQLLSIEYCGPVAYAKYAIFIPVDIVVRKLIDSSFDITPHTYYREVSRHSPELENHVWGMYRNVVSAAFKNEAPEVSRRMPNGRGEFTTFTIGKAPQGVKLRAKYNRTAEGLHISFILQFRVKIPDPHTSWFDDYLESDDAEPVTPAEAVLNVPQAFCEGRFCIRMPANKLPEVLALSQENELSIDTLCKIEGASTTGTGHGSILHCIRTGAAANHKVKVVQEVSSSRMMEQRAENYAGPFLITEKDYYRQQIMEDELQIALDILSDSFQEFLASEVESAQGDYSNPPQVPQGIKDTVHKIVENTSAEEVPWNNLDAAAQNANYVYDELTTAWSTAARTSTTNTRTPRSGNGDSSYVYVNNGR